jgi:hypothetical protein
MHHRPHLFGNSSSDVFITSNSVQSHALHYFHVSTECNVARVTTVLLTPEAYDWGINQRVLYNFL